MVLQKPGEPFLVVKAGMEVVAHRRCMPLAQAVVEPLVIGVVEALLLHGPFQVPVDLGHEGETRHALGCSRPEKRRTLAPGPFEDFG